MELIDQRTKKIMEQCKARARDAGLSFDKESLEYIVTNQDMVSLSPKVMIPTLYDYWVHDVDVLKGQGKYKLYPNNPYETVINSRPAISFYNDNNPDWMNIMIFYHVLAHIDFFQKNKFFEHTWTDDFVGQALADKRLIASLRSQHGRWTDYAIEFSRSIDNLVGYFPKIATYNYPHSLEPSAQIDYYFDVFLQEVKKVSGHELYREVERYNALMMHDEEVRSSLFFAEVRHKYPEFQAKFEKFSDEDHLGEVDVMEYIMLNSPFLKKEEHKWMRLVMSIVRNTSLYFQPQIRTKIINEGWASYWHDALFRTDDRIGGHEVGYARLNAGVTSVSRVGLNPYAIGLRLIQYIEDLANKGKLNYQYQKIENAETRAEYNKHTGEGKSAIFHLREHFSDFTLINAHVSQDFVDEYNLFVVGQRNNPRRGTIEYYVKSRKAEDYKKMLIDSLYHPPSIFVNKELTNEKNLYLVHRFEKKQLYQGYISEAMMGVEYLWGSQIQLETTEIINKSTKPTYPEEHPFEYRRVLYTMKEKQLTKKILENAQPIPS